MRTIAQYPEQASCHKYDEDAPSRLTLPRQLAATANQYCAVRNQSALAASASAAVHNQLVLAASALAAVQEPASRLQSLSIE